MILGFFGVAGPHWLSNKTAALFIICLLRVWQFGSTMVIILMIFTAILQYSQKHWVYYSDEEA